MNTHQRNNKARNSLHYYLTLALIIITGCGRKPRHLFDPEKKQPEEAFHRLALPAVKGITLEKHNKGNLISWNELSYVPPSREEQPPTLHHEDALPPAPIFIGYNVYRFATAAFVPEHPLNKKPITAMSYLDELPPKKYEWGYVVRPVFKDRKALIEGVSSQIIIDTLP